MRHIADVVTCQVVGLNPAGHLVMHLAGNRIEQWRAAFRGSFNRRQETPFGAAVVICEDSVDPIEFTTVTTADEVCEILRLQAENVPSALTPATMATEGFVTVRHDAVVLQRMNEAAPAIIAKAAGRVVGYALVMPRSFAADVPILRPLFALLDTLSWKGVSLRSNSRWFVMGQICLADGYRGVGIFDGLYRTMAEKYRDRFDFTVTEVAARNTRSLKAHARVGFQTVHVYPDAITGEDWHVIALDLVP